MRAPGGPRLLLRRLREVMAEPVTAQARLDRIVVLIATILEAMRTTMRSRRAWAVTGSAMTSRSRRSNRRGPPGARIQDLSLIHI